MYVNALFDPKEIPDDLLDCFEEVQVICGAPWRRVIKSSGGRDWKNGKIKAVGIPGERDGEGGNKRGQPAESMNDVQEKQTIGWEPSCECQAEEPVPCTVLDPFCGAGTTGVVSKTHGRSFIGVDVNEKYCKLAEARIAKAKEKHPELFDMTW